MQKLIQGIHDFQSNIFGRNQDLFVRLAKDGQEPAALFITCSDSRIVPNLITQTEPGELFVLRNAGNLVPPFPHGGWGEAATIEYALNALEIPDVIICGHSCCGAMQALLNPRLAEGMPSVTQWLNHAQNTRRIMNEKYRHLSGSALATATAEENVLVQLEHLRTHPSVAARLSKGTLKLHAWMYKLETGQVFAYDAERQQYVPVLETSALRPAVTDLNTPLTRTQPARNPTAAL
jgi:carbonic anhydrase